MRRRMPRPVVTVVLQMPYNREYMIHQWRGDLRRFLCTLTGCIINLLLQCRKATLEAQDFSYTVTILRIIRGSRRSGGHFKSYVTITGCFWYAFIPKFKAIAVLE